MPKGKSMGHELNLNHTIVFKASAHMWFILWHQFVMAVGPQTPFPGCQLGHHSHLLEAPCSSGPQASHTPSHNITANLLHASNVSDFHFCREPEKLAASKGHSWLDEAHQDNLHMLRLIYLGLELDMQNPCTAVSNALKSDQDIFKSWFIHLPMCALNNLFNTWA